MNDGPEVGVMMVPEEAPMPIEILVFLGFLLLCITVSIGIARLRARKSLFQVPTKQGEIPPAARPSFEMPVGGSQPQTLFSGRPTPVPPQPAQPAQQARESEPSTVVDKAKLVYALRKEQGIDVDRFVEGETAVIIGALQKGHKPEDIVRALSERKPRDAARRLGLY